VGGANELVGGATWLVGGVKKLVGGTTWPVDEASKPVGAATLPWGGTNKLLGGAREPVGGAVTLTLTLARDLALSRTFAVLRSHISAADSSVQNKRVHMFTARVSE